MKIVRFLNANGSIEWGHLHADGHATLLAGDPFGTCIDTGAPAAIDKLLAPVVPRDIFCMPPREISRFLNTPSSS
jgi:hypothetical protein